MQVEITDLRRKTDSVLSELEPGQWFEVETGDGEVRIVMLLCRSDVYHPKNEGGAISLPVVDIKTGDVLWLALETTCRKLNVALFVNAAGYSAVPKAFDS